MAGTSTDYRSKVGRKLIAFMNSYSQGKSGGDICFIEIAKRLKQYEKLVITSLLGKKLCQDRELKANFIITTREQCFKKVIITYFRRTVNALRLRLVSEPGEIIYSTSDFFPDVIPAFCLKIKNPQAIWLQKIFHLIPKERVIPHYAQQVSFLLIKRYANVVIVDNELLVNDLVERGFQPSKIKVNYLGVDLDCFAKLRQDKKKNYDGVFLGRIHPSKGIYDLISIWNRVCTQIPEAKLAIIGGGRREVVKELKTIIGKEGLGKNVELLGSLEDKEAFLIVASSRLFVFPSHEEGFGIVICEAMALGVPVVAYELPAYEYTFKKGITTILRYNIELFAENIVKLLTDGTRYKEQIIVGAEIVKGFTWSSSANNELDIIRSLEREKASWLL